MRIFTFELHDLYRQRYDIDTSIYLNKFQANNPDSGVLMSRRLSNFIYYPKSRNASVDG